MRHIAWHVAITALQLGVLMVKANQNPSLIPSSICDENCLDSLPELIAILSTSKVSVCVSFDPPALSLGLVCSCQVEVVAVM